MSFNLYKTVVPFKIELIYQGNGESFNPFPPLLKNFFEPWTMDSAGDIIDTVFPKPLDNWDFVSDSFKYKNLYVSKMTYQQYTVYLVNETTHPGSDEWILSIFSDDAKSLEVFCSDFAVYGQIISNSHVAIFL